MAEVISVVDMNAGETGKVVGLQGGHGMMGNLENLGIRIGCQIRKVSQQLMSGPIVISHRNTQVAIGRGMAQRIMVEVEV